MQWDGRRETRAQKHMDMIARHTPAGVPERVCTDKSGGDGQEKQGKDMGDMMGRVNIGSYGRLYIGNCGF